MREATTFSRILEMKLRFEIGRKLLRSSVDRDGFLRRGWTRACLNDDGKIPSERERLTRFVMCDCAKYIACVGTQRAIARRRRVDEMTESRVLFIDWCCPTAVAPD